MCLRDKLLLELNLKHMKPPSAEQRIGQKEVHVVHFRAKLGSIRPSLLATKGRRQGEGPAAGSVMGC